MGALGVEPPAEPEPEPVTDPNAEVADETSGLTAADAGAGTEPVTDPTAVVTDEAAEETGAGKGTGEAGMLGSVVGGVDVGAAVPDVPVHPAAPDTVDTVPPRPPRDPVADPAWSRVLHTWLGIGVEAKESAGVPIMPAAPAAMLMTPSHLTPRRVDLFLSVDVRNT